VREPLLIPVTSIGGTGVGVKGKGAEIDKIVDFGRGIVEPGVHRGRDGQEREMTEKPWLDMKPEQIRVWMEEREEQEYMRIAAEGLALCGQ